MAQSKYIQSLKRAVGGRELSMEWYRKKIIEFGKPTSAQLVREGRRKATPFIGKLNMFVYDPKLKQKSDFQIEWEFIKNGQIEELSPYVDNFINWLLDDREKGASRFDPNQEDKSYGL